MTASKSAEDAWIFQEDLNKLAIRIKTWGMQLNIDKCQVFRVALKHNPCITEYFLQNQKLITSTKAKYSDITFDTKLNFNHHVDSVFQKANQILSFYVETWNSATAKLN